MNDMQPSGEWVWAPDKGSDHSVLPAVEHFLTKCSGSYEGIWTKEEMLQMVEHQVLNPIFYMVNEVAVAMILYSIQRYSPTVLSIKLELFCSVVSMWKVTALMDVLEFRARQAGITFIEAVAHPTLAEFLVKKKDFQAPSVYVKKTVKYERMN